ncbi:MAG: SsrA-binding protein SmpB [Gammaproteobacteria bacterium]|nr:SsrA-binding protein SmpB [Gammaproteobacteria bacterium]MDE0411366.1 SsrA-binding protein SmpB [Gammaproteobacteria bacterium]
MTPAKPKQDNQIAVNKKARHDYFIIEHLEAGLVLEGWEVKSLRAKHLQLKESYVLIKNMQAWLLGAHINPLPTASSHVHADPTRTRRLLLHRGEIAKLVGAVDRKGYTIVPLSMYWKRGKAKLEIAIAKGKQKHDRRASIRERDWERDRQRILKKAK